METILCALIMSQHGELEMTHLGAADHFKNEGDSIEMNHGKWIILKLYWIEIGPSFDKSAILKHFNLSQKETFHDGR